MSLCYSLSYVFSHSGHSLPLSLVVCSLSTSMHSLSLISHYSFPLFDSISLSFLSRSHPQAISVSVSHCFPFSLVVSLPLIICLSLSLTRCLSHSLLISLICSITHCLSHSFSFTLSASFLPHPFTSYSHSSLSITHASSHLLIAPLLTLSLSFAHLSFLLTHTHSL